MVDNDEIVSKLASLVSQGRCILFLGAAVHSPPPDSSLYSYPPADRPLLGGQLSEHLAIKGKFQDSYPQGNLRDLQRVALHFEIRESRAALVSEIRTAIHDGKKPSPIVRALAKLDFPIVITTNYDQLFERALRRIAKEPIFSIYKKNEEKEQESTDEYPGGDDPCPQRPFIFKIHGDVDRPESIVITDEDYIHFVLRMGDKSPFNPIPDAIQYRLKKWPTLFLGYSLMDYNLRLLFKTLRWRVDRSRWPDTYSVDRSPDPLIFEVWNNQRKYVKYVVSDVWSFVPQLYRNVTGEEMKE